MLPSVIRSCPSADNDFLPLSEYQAQTPDTFFDGKPVLHFHDATTKAWVSEDRHIEQLFFFSDPVAAPTPPESQTLRGDHNSGVREEKNVEVFVSSTKLTLFSHDSQTGIEIPYPAITLHAIKNFKLEENDQFAGVYMQLEFSSPDDDDSFDPIELTLIPCNKSTSEQSLDPLNAERTHALFNQISACSNLNPDPRNEEGDNSDDEFNADHIIFEGHVDRDGQEVDGLPGVLQGDSNGGLPPPLPGSSGWITADNVDQYFDKDGNWIGQGGGGDDDDDAVSGELGDGAGHVHGRDVVDQNGANGVDESDQAADAKRPRTE
ncbi:regulator of volume decrease after cellular swelling-domain-containing protein [Xylariaceae sp. FL0255]|nr:regulator of volume decrease after cellular swelling-domain-containing protein [Xylariaceae sp. FL0255]